jgi:SAM-dependent methyltransferase
MQQAAGMSRPEGPIAALQAQRQDYARAWQVTSAYFADEGHYDWMAEQLAGFRHVLEIGCGAGYSSEVLCTAGHSLVALDENPECVRRAAERLRAAGHDAQTVLRGRVALRENGRYAINYAKIPHGTARTGLVLEADAMHDERLQQWFAAGPKFDAVACWLTGTHHGRGGNVHVQSLNLANAGMLRQALQRKTYELAALVLRAGGRLNIIDRMQLPDSPALLAQLEANHARLAQGTGLRVTSIATRPYREPAQEGQTMMVVSREADTRIFDARRLALVSVVAEKF